MSGPGPHGLVGLRYLGPQCIVSGMCLDASDAEYCLTTQAHQLMPSLSLSALKANWKHTRVGHWSFCPTNAQVHTRPNRGESTYCSASLLTVLAGQLKRAAVELAKLWRLDKYLRRLDVRGHSSHVPDRNSASFT